VYAALQPAMAVKQKGRAVSRSKRLLEEELARMVCQNWESTGLGSVEWKVVG